MCSPQWQVLFDALIRPELVPPIAYLDHAQDWRPEYRLSVRVMEGQMKLAHESLAYEYPQWYDREESVVKATAETLPTLDVGDLAMLDPAVSHSLIVVASDHGEWVELVGDWRDDQEESPIFRAGDHDPYVNLLGTCVPHWLGLEIDATLARLVAAERAEAVSRGATYLR